MRRRRQSLAETHAQAEAAVSGQPLPSIARRKTPRRLESAQGMALIQWADLQARMGRRPCLKHLRHIPNGGARDARTGARLKAEGVRAGTWDYVLPVVMREAGMLDGNAPPQLRWPGLWIELKIESERNHKHGGLSEKQLEFGSFVHEQGYATVVAYSAEEATNALEAYLDNKPIPHFWVPEVSHGTR